MRNKRMSIPFFITFVIYALINLIMFLNADSLRTDSPVFWIAWSIAFPLQLLILAFFGFVKKWNSALTERTLLYPIILFAAFAYLAVGFIFMFAPIDSIKALIITEAIVTALYIVIFFIAKNNADYLTKSQAYTKQKVSFLRILKADVDDIALRASDPAFMAALNELSEKIRYSDPMSSPALAPYEAEISQLIRSAGQYAQVGRTAEALAMISNASFKLDSRNQRCKILK